jgi:hypothetical protein
MRKYTIENIRFFKTTYEISVFDALTLLRLSML